MRMHADSEISIGMVSFILLSVFDVVIDIIIDLLEKMLVSFTSVQNPWTCCRLIFVAFLPDLCYLTNCSNQLMPLSLYTNLTMCT